MPVLKHLSLITGKSLIDTPDDETDITAIRGRALSYQLINGSEGGIAYTWSSIALQKAFIDGATPLPIVLCEERAPGQMLIRK